MRQCPRCSSRYEDAVGFCPRDGSGLEEIKDSLIGQEVGHYKISSLIGEGGMGAVYLAVHPGIGSRVAVKVLHPELARDRAAVDRFFAEARSVNLIHHENIVNILDLAQLTDGRSYIVMEYLEGESVAARLRKKGPFTPKDAVALMLPVLAALQAAHEKGITHRDLKPDNIYLTRGGQVKVLDFGIAKLDIAHGGGAATRTGAILGTPMYMSPEQAAGRASQVDHRSDIYSAGIILHELVAGKVPFISEALYDLITKHLTEPPPPLRTLKADCPPELEAVVLRALAKERDARFSTAAAMAEELQRVADLVAARPATAAGAAVPLGMGPAPSTPVPVGPSLTPSYMTPPAAGLPPTYAPTPQPGPPSGFVATPPTAYAGTPPPAIYPAQTPYPPAMMPPTAALPHTTPALAMPPGTMGGAATPYRPVTPTRPSSGGVWALVAVLVVGGLAAGYAFKLFPFQKGKGGGVVAQDGGAVAEAVDGAAVVPIGSVDAGPMPGPKVAVKAGKTSIEVAQTGDRDLVGRTTDEEKAKAREKADKEKEKRDKEKEKKKKDPPPPVEDVYKRLEKQKEVFEKLKGEVGLSGTYTGRILNTTTNTRSTGQMQLTVKGTNVFGMLRVDPPLGGSGPIVGTVNGTRMSLTVHSPQGTIRMDGHVLGRTITGSYSASGPMLVGGAQRGSFTMRKQ
jgi:serine/threonine-protein kinase